MNCAVLFRPGTAPTRNQTSASNTPNPPIAPDNRQHPILDHFGRKQVFRIRSARTYFGRPRPIIECTCTRRVIRLFSKFGTYACRKCHGAVYTSQRQDSKGRKRFKAAKLRLELGGLPNNKEALPAKCKWAHRRRYQRLRSQVQALEAAIKPKRFRKPIDIQVFAYHLPS